MKHVLLTSLLFAGACASDRQPVPEPSNDTAAFEPDGPEYNGFEKDGVLYLTPEREQGSVCECTTEDCLRDWIVESIGCGSCVRFECAAGPRGSCVSCDASLEVTGTLGLDDSDPVWGAIDGAPTATDLTEQCGADQPIITEDTLCTLDLVAFCGCDGTTFYSSSTCPAHAVAHRGACEGASVRRPGSVLGSIDATPEATELEEQCGANQPIITDDTPCTSDYVPFCGCDGETFFSSSSCPSQPFSYRGTCE